MNEKHEQLIADYLSGELDDVGKTRLEELIASGEIDFMEFLEVEKLYEELGAIPTQKPSEKLSNRFYLMLEEEKKSIKPGWWKVFIDKVLLEVSNLTAPKLAYALVLLVIGGFIGSQINNDQSEIEQLSQEMQSMKEMMLVNMLEGSSAADRLKAVNISSEFSTVDLDAIHALLFTLNNDPSVNVRIQAVEALKRWGDDERVRRGLVRSISTQESPIVITELADTMIELELKASAPEFQKLLEERELDYSVQQKLESSIAVLM
ncbi:HEAT repeat domain-containing protein [Gracilimonas tropica]|uniref:HEAT repeat domain-containing protein n=1 Tax=Gracilimonas tropica TaxID=454600 RepID=UPI000374BCDA|nr:HEAT repeat domain-containing protein [Gracilimonas tropica]